MMVNTLRQQSIDRVAKEDDALNSADTVIKMENHPLLQAFFRSYKETGGVFCVAADGYNKILLFVKDPLSSVNDALGKLAVRLTAQKRALALQNDLADLSAARTAYNQAESDIAKLEEQARQLMSAEEKEQNRADREAAEASRLKALHSIEKLILSATTESPGEAHVVVLPETSGQETVIFDPRARWTPRRRVAALTLAQAFAKLEGDAANSFPFILGSERACRHQSPFESRPLRKF